MITPEKQTIEQILVGTKTTYSVPRYQRSFDWGKSELQELVEDLKDAQSKELFLGNFIFDISDSSNYKIVDGQQRLTTISLIFIALREQAKKLNELVMKNEIQPMISVYSQIRNKNDVKIAVSDNIRIIFEYMAHPDWNGDFPEKIDGKSIKRQINKVKPIYKYLADSFKLFNSNDLSTFINTLWDAYVVVIKVENIGDVFSVFERTNARGLDLNIGDLLKNYIFSHQDDKLEQKWSEIVDNADGSLPRLLKYFWVSRKGYIQQSNLYQSLKRYVKEIDPDDVNGINIFVNELYEFSRFYHIVQSLDPIIVKEWFEEYDMSDISNNEDYYTRINRVFQALKLFRVTQAYPLIFSIIYAFKKSSLKINRLFNTLETIEKYHFVNNVICNRIGNEVETFYAESAEKIFKTNDLSTELDKLIKVLSQKKALEDEFTANFIDNVTYNQKNISLINYIFDRVNNFDLLKKSPLKGSQYTSIYSPEKNLTKRNYNIEHFFAQDNKKDYKEDELDMFDRIGNLLLISRHSNSEFGCKSPKEKIDLIESDKKHFGNLRYLDNFLNMYRSKFDNWGLNEINERSLEFSKSAYNHIWHF